MGLTSAVSRTCLSKEKVCTQPESVYWSSYPAHTTTTQSPSTNNSGSSSSSEFPWWAILLIMLLVVILAVVAMLVTWCCRGCGACMCSPPRKTSIADAAAQVREHAEDTQVVEGELRERTADDGAWATSVETFAPSAASVRTQLAIKLNPFAFHRQSFTQSEGKVMTVAAATNCEAATAGDSVVAFNEWSERHLNPLELGGQVCDNALVSLVLFFVLFFFLFCF